MRWRTLTSQALDRIGGLNMPMHGGRELVKGQEVLFILNEASHRLWIALSVLGFEGRQLCQGLLLTRLLPDANEFGLHIAPLSSRDGAQDIALLMRLAIVDEGLPKRVPRQRPAARHARQ